MATFSSKIAPILYILMIKEHTIHIYDDLKIKRENSQVHSLLKITKLMPGSIDLAIQQILRYFSSDKKEAKNLCLQGVNYNVSCLLLRSYYSHQVLLFSRKSFKTIFNILGRYQSYLQKFYRYNVSESIRWQIFKFIV